MMSAGFIPSGTTDVVHALLKVVADPDSARARLNEIAEHEAAAQSKWDEANGLLQRLAAETSAFEERTAAAAITAAEQQVGLERRLAEVDRREKLLGDFAAKVAAAEARVAAIAEEISVRSKTLEHINLQLNALREKF